MPLSKSVLYYTVQEAAAIKKSLCKMTGLETVVLQRSNNASKSGNKPAGSTTVENESNKVKSESSTHWELYIIFHLLTIPVRLVDELFNFPSTDKLTDSERQSAFIVDLRKPKNCNAFTSVDSKSVPNDANIIGSHIDYKKKFDLWPKALNVPWEH